MFTKNKNDSCCSMYCSCGCLNGVILNADKDGDMGYRISLVTDIWNSSQETGWDKFKEKCRRIWRILRNKEHHYFDIYLKDGDITEFKEFVAKL